MSVTGDTSTVTAWRRHPVLALALGLSAVALVGGCGQQVGGTDDRAGGGTGEAGAVADGPAAGSPKPEPSLPPGDPGLDAPAVPNPGFKGGDDDHGDEPARTRVPRAALLTVQDLELNLGGSWLEHSAPAVDCTRPGPAVARRTLGFSGKAQVTQTVSTHEGIAAADAAVDTARDRLRRCGWRIGGDPRVGSAAVEAFTEDAVATVAAFEGVTVVLVGDRRLAGWRWDMLVDIAVGSVCPAAPDGCH